MLRSLYTAATGMEAQELKMDTISNNLANASTTGFKRTRAEFEDLLSETVRAPSAPDPRGGTAPSPLEVGLGVRTVATTRSFTQGDMINTQNQLDVAIEGNGFFVVQRANGEPAYTRAGNFRVDATGRLCTPNGDLIDPEIVVPPESIDLTIRPDGTVEARMPGRDEPMPLGHIELVQFANPGGLQAMGNNLLAASASSGEAVRLRPGEQGMGSLAQGYLETSNVKAVEEMIDMISTQRAYEMNSKVIQTADQMLQRLTSLR